MARPFRFSAHPSTQGVETIEKLGIAVTECGGLGCGTHVRADLRVGLTVHITLAIGYG